MSFEVMHKSFDDFFFCIVHSSDPFSKHPRLYRFFFKILRRNDFPEMYLQQQKQQQ